MPNERSLDPQSQEIIDGLAAATDVPPYYRLSPRELRQGHEDFFLPLSLPERDLVHIGEAYIQGRDDNQIRVRIYHPKIRESEFLPALVFYHGGGMMVGSIEGYDTICQRMCSKAEFAIVSVDYRLAPEEKFPAAHNDALDALCWVHGNAAALGIDVTRLAVGGDSGGGLLAAVMAHYSKKEKAPPVAFQLLIYPFLGKRRDYQSRTDYADGYFGSLRQLNWFLANYMAFPDQLNDWRMCPILADSFDGLPPALIVTAGFDMLRNESEHYAELLTAANVPTETRCFDSTFHPFFNAAGVLDVGKTAIDECALKLRLALGA